MISATFSTPSERPTLVLQNVSVQHHDAGSSGQRRSDLPKLEDVSMYMVEGESVGILASTTDGSTLLTDLVSGNLAPDTGAVFIRPGSCILGAPTTSELKLSLEEVIQRLAMTQEVNGRALKKAVARTVRQIGLEDDHLFTRVSDLEPAIVELARLSAALNTSPSLLIAVSSIASGNVLLTDPGKAWYERYLSRRGSCLMFASNTRTLVRACSRIIWLYEGRVIMDRPAIEVHREFVRFEAAKDDRMQQAQLLRRYALELVQPKITTY